MLYTKRTYDTENSVNVVYEINTKILETIEQIDICTVMFNLLDNAIDYSIKNNKEEVLLKIYRNKGFFVVVTENECSEFSTATDKLDKDNHGVGLKITKDISKKYNGSEYIGVRDNKFIHIVNLEIR